MKKILKNKKLWIAVYFVSLVLINIAIIIIFRKKARFTFPSLIPLGFIIMTVYLGIKAHLYRHKGNFLELKGRYSPGPSVFSDDKEYTFTEKYNKNLNIQLLIYFSCIPFYIPLVFFSGTTLAYGIILLLLLLPYTLFEVKYFVFDFPKMVKEEKKRAQRQAEELREKKYREEMGYKD